MSSDESEKKSVIGATEGWGPEEGGGRFIDIPPEALFFASSESLDRLVDHVANGGHLIDFCQLQRVRFSEVMKWLKQDTDRWSAFKEAEAMRKQYIMQSVERELCRISEFDIRSIFATDGSILPREAWSDAAGSVIAGMEVKVLYDQDEDGDRIEIGKLVKIKLWDKTKTLEQVAKIQKMFGMDQEQAADDLLGILKKMHKKNFVKLNPPAAPIEVKGRVVNEPVSEPAETKGESDGQIL